MKKNFRILKFKKDKPVFEVKDVSKSYDGRPILKKLSINLFVDINNLLNFFFVIFIFNIYAIL